ncbi:hypothetical protein [Neisseria cinerea]
MPFHSTDLSKGAAAKGAGMGLLQGLAPNIRLETKEMPSENQLGFRRHS